MVASRACSNVLIGLMASIALAASSLAQAATRIHVSAAASLTDAMNEAIAEYAADHDVDILPIYASSSTLARQIANGAPADVFVSANEKWMDWLPEQGVELKNRADLLHNRLALIASRDGDVTTFIPGENGEIASLLDEGERFSVGDPDHVPAGIYTKQALESLGEWQTLESRLARAGDVRGALALVERGETPAGAVYQTDAKASDKVRLLGLFPQDSHDPIVYPVALVNPDAGDEAEAFREWLGSDAALEVFESYGFATAND
ncbi:molybdate ABC transporter substrate-binding protein [Pistricoccus aurantiacus]|uniref:molybdate ABC transporter substrate-binding protein n=1 Tax=Pistricoccus aurantiacus TaxID=1883414 RepID=UPI00362F1994